MLILHTILKKYSIVFNIPYKTYDYVYPVYIAIWYKLKAILMVHGCDGWLELVETR